MRSPIRAAANPPPPVPCRAVVLWIDWYAYHLARFAGLQAAFGDQGEVRGMELVGGVGVHAHLQFREGLPAGLPVETLLAGTGWHQANKLQLAKRVWQRLSTLDPELVLVPGYYTLPAVAAALWAKLHHRTSVLMTESTAADHARTAWKEWLKSTVIRALFDWAVTGGTAHVRYLQQLGFPAERIVRFYDVVDNLALGERSRTLRRRTAADHGLPAKYFLFVGRLAAEKNVSGLLSAWLAYRDGGGAWPLMLVGDGPEAASLKAMAAQSDYAQDVHFAGHKSSKELPPFYSFASCFVLPSTREPWGLVVNEAMACSLPVIVSNRCGCAEDLVIDGLNGFLFDPADSEALTNCLHWIQLLDGADREEMGAYSAERVSEYSPENFGRDIARIAGAAHNQFPERAPIAKHRESSEQLSCPLPGIGDGRFAQTQQQLRSKR